MRIELSAMFDSVVMLTWSNWHTEPRSNRYHYATRFAQHLPVLFVQPDLDRAAFRFEQTGIANLEILHVFRYGGTLQTRLLNEAISSRNIRKPLLWIYNPFFLHFIERHSAALRVFHATETYFLNDYVDYDATLQQQLRILLNHVDLLVAASEEVCQDYVLLGPYEGQTLVLPNGCDYPFWSSLGEKLPSEFAPRIAFYQGGMNRRLDARLLRTVILGLPTWQFWFCGQPHGPWMSTDWRTLAALPNVRYFGYLSVEEVRALAQQSTVGLVPFVQSPSMYKSLPLKAFEYVAAGLPVVSIPIQALEKYQDVFWFAQNPSEFIDAIENAAPTRFHEQASSHRKTVAAAQDYDVRFACLLAVLQNLSVSRSPSPNPLNIVTLYSNEAVIQSGLLAMLNQSRHHQYFIRVEPRSRLSVDHLDWFDGVLVDSGVLNAARKLHSTLSGYGGFRVLLTSDGETLDSPRELFHATLSANLTADELDRWLTTHIQHARRLPLRLLPVLTTPAKGDLTPVGRMQSSSSFPFNTPSDHNQTIYFQLPPGVLWRALYTELQIKVAYLQTTFGWQISAILRRLFVLFLPSPIKAHLLRWRAHRRQ